MATKRLALTVSLKVPDNEARSALEAIRVKMGLSDRVRDLAREEVWELDVECGSVEDARSEVDGLVRSTNLFANPNKHRYSLEEGSAGGVELAPDEVAILVSDREGSVGDSMVAALGRLGVACVVGARRWVRWRVSLSEHAARGEPGLLPLIQRIGVTDSRGGGLLCNPHIELARAVFPWGEEKSLAD